MATKTAVKDVTRLSAYSPAGDLTPMEDIAGTDLMLTHLQEQATEYGHGYKMTLVNQENGDEYTCLSSAKVIVSQLYTFLARDEGKLPMLVRFAKKGRCWVIE